MKAFNQRLIEEFRANGGQLSGPMAGRVLMLLTTTGRRTGKAHTVVLGFRKQDESYIVIASANGAPQDPDWYRNLVAHPTVTVEVGAEKFGARARTAQADEREALARLIPYYEGERAKTTREIPVVVLEPTKA